jgi:hypothetical protein
LGVAIAADTDEEDESDPDAFAGGPAEEDMGEDGVLDEGLDLVYLQALNCYYCPANQQFYEFEGRE